MATYPVADGFGTVQKAGRQPGAVTLPLAGGAVGVFQRATPTNIFVSRPGAGYQVEVYSPDAAEARDLVLSGQIAPVGTSGEATPRAASRAELSALARTLDTPLFWAGPRGAARYEVTQTAAGGTFVRYLPADAPLGDPRADFMTVATYPQEDGFAQVQAAGRRPGAVTVDLPGGGLAVVDGARPTSVYFSAPGAPYQVEVYSPRPGEARRLVESGAVRAID